MATLAQIRQTIGEYNFSRSTNRTPPRLAAPSLKPLGSNIMSRANVRRFSQIVQSWDTANKATELSDYSVCTTWGVHEKRYYLLDVFRQRLN